MDFGYLLRILARRKWLILAVALASAVAAYAFIGHKALRYRASITMSTGIVNYKGINSDNSDAFVQQYQVENAFSNLIEFAQSRSCLKLLAVHLLRHDLEAKQGGGQPFRQPNRSLANFSEQEEQQLFTQIKALNLDSLADPAFTPEFDYLLDKVSRAYGYDYDAIRRGLSVKRKAETDYLTADFVTESPQLSKFLADAYGQRFLVFYRNLAVREKRKDVEFYTKMAAEKKTAMDSSKIKLYDYLQRNRLPNLGKQSEEVVSQIKELELQKQSAMAKRQASEESVGLIKGYMDNRGNLDAGDTRERVVEKYKTEEQRKRVIDLTEKSIKAGRKDPKVEAELSVAKDELDRSLRSQASTVGKRKTDESKRTREDLYKDMVGADVDRTDAEKSLNAINSELATARGQLSRFVVNDQVATGLQADYLRAEKDFDDTNNQLLEAKRKYDNTETTLHIIENAQLPEWPEPNRQKILSAFAGVVGGSLTIIAILLLAYFDRSLQSPELFKKMAGDIPLLGTVSSVPLKGLNFQKVFSPNGSAAPPAQVVFRESLRKIRTLILQSKQKLFLFVSTKPREGKSFTMNALAHSLAANNKRVLLLDTNFKAPLLSSLAEEGSPDHATLNEAIQAAGLSEVFKFKKPGEGAPAQPGMVEVLANTDLHASPSELLEPEAFRQFLAALSTQYDFIFMEAAALNRFSDAHELAPFAERIVAVFNAGSSLESVDKESIAFLQGLPEQFGGAVLTEVDPRNIH